MFDRIARTTYLSALLRVCFSGFGKGNLPKTALVSWTAFQLVGSLCAGGSYAVFRRPRNSLLTFYEFDSVAVGIFDEEDPGPAAHGVRLALEVHAAGFFEPVREGVEVFDGEGDVAVAGP